MLNLYRPPLRKELFKLKSLLLLDCNIYVIPIEPVKCGIVVVLLILPPLCFTRIYIHISSYYLLRS